MCMNKDKNKSFIPKLVKDTPSKRKTSGKQIYYRDNPEINKFAPAWDGVQFLGYTDKSRLGLFIVGKKGKIKDVVEVASLKKCYTFNRMQEDVFVSLNSLKFINGKIARDQKHVSYLNRLWADIDCTTPEDASLILYELTENVFGKSLPTPSYVMFSGTGLWLFWAISAPMQAVGKWHVCQQHIYEVLKEYGADGSVTHDIARICRYSGSYNSKDIRTTDGRTYHNRVGIVNYTGKIHSLDRFINDYVEESLRGRKFFANKTAAFAYAMEKNNRAFLRDLDTLLQLRECDLDGCRELYFFIMRVLLMRLEYTDEEAVEYMQNRNSLLINPLGNRELVKATESASRYSERYGFGSSYITRVLDITNEEMQYLSILKSKEQKKAHKKDYDKNRYISKLQKSKKKTKQEDISSKLSKMKRMLKKGMSKQEICDSLKISKSTYYNYKERLEELDFQQVLSKESNSNKSSNRSNAAIRNNKKNASKKIKRDRKNAISNSHVCNCIENPSVLVKLDMDNCLEDGTKYANIFLDWSPKIFTRNYKEHAPKGLAGKSRSKATISTTKPTSGTELRSREKVSHIHASRLSQTLGQVNSS